jgi:hypothetical protein
MATQLQIVNLALTRLGVPRIASMSEQSPAALSASAVWELVRDEVLAKHPWNRTTTRADLRRVTDAAKIVSNVTSATDAVITTTKPHGYLVDDVILILGVEGCLDEDNVSVLNGFYHTVTAVPTASTFTIGEDTTSATAYSQDGLALRVRTRRLGESVATISGATQASPCVITTATAHGLVNGDQIYIDSVVGMTDLNGRYYLVGNVPTTTTFELMGVNSSTYSAYSSAGTIQRVLGMFTDWDFQYQLPTDCLRVLDVSYDDGSNDWQVEAGSILVSDFGPDIGIRYIQRLSDVTQYEPLLVNALASRLAAELAQFLTNPQKKQAALAEYIGFLDEAKIADLREQTPTSIEDDTWITVRY